MVCEVEGGTTAEFVKSNRIGLDGRRQRYVFVTSVRVEGSALTAGDWIEIVYGDRSAGSSGFVAGLHPEGPEPIKIVVDPSGAGKWVSLSAEASPIIEVVCAEATELVLTAPSVIAHDEEIRLHLAVLDRLGNRVDDFVGEIWIEPSDNQIVKAQMVQLRREDRGIREIVMRASHRGVLRLRARHQSGLHATSNPVLSRAGTPALRLFWGELHSHAERSFDATGRHPFDYARNVSALDCFALTDHAEGWPDGTWEWLRDQVRRHNETGRFVTLLAYEATFGSPWGHHNVYFRGDDGPVVGADAGTLLDLWGVLRAGDAFTIPHHTGVCFSPLTTGAIVGGQCPNPDWSHHDSDLRRLVEIYSGHGQCESYDPGHPLSYENCDFSINTSAEGPHYVWDAWRRGHILGIVASSDNHRGQPGRTETGLTGIWASTLDRECIFDAMVNRSTYGTTGSRLILEFDLDGISMGGRLAPAGPVTARIRVHATGNLERVELVVGDLGTGKFRVAQAWESHGLDLNAEWTDPAPPIKGLYYARVLQQNKVRGRPVMAWSSPVWVGADSTARA